MLKLTRHYDGATVFFAAAHIVGLFPDENEDGCYVETVNDSNYDQSPLRVKEDIASIAEHPLMNPAQ